LLFGIFHFSRLNFLEFGVLITSFGPLIFIIFGFALLLSLVKSIILMNRKDVFYIILTTRAEYENFFPQTLTIFSGEDGEFAQNLTNRIRACLKP
jgi:hypothetical protein